MNKKLCTILHLVYHALFGSTMYIAGSDYLEEFRAIRTEIRTQSDRITKQVSRLNSGVVKTKQSFDKLEKIGKKLEKACKAF
jgi:hypothetical protein